MKRTIFLTMHLLGVFFANGSEKKANRSHSNFFAGCSQVERYDEFKVERAFSWHDIQPWSDVAKVVVSTPPAVKTVFQEGPMHGSAISSCCLERGGACSKRVVRKDVAQDLSEWSGTKIRREEVYPSDSDTSE